LVKVAHTTEHKGIGRNGESLPRHFAIEHLTNKRRKVNAIAEEDQFLIGNSLGPKLIQHRLGVSNCNIEARMTTALDHTECSEFFLIPVLRHAAHCQGSSSLGHHIGHDGSKVSAR